MKEQLTINFEEEVWLPVKGYEGIYEISNMGQLKSLARRVGVMAKPVKETIIKPDCTGRYKRVLLTDKNSVSKKESIHRLVAKHFVPNPDNFPIVNHLDCVRFNNRWDNLQWSTIQLNTKHAYDNGLLHDLRPYHFKKGRKGYKEGKIIVNIENGIYYDSITDAANSVGMIMSTLSGKLTGKTRNNTPFRYA